jgi:hypothetical protein
MLHILVAGSLDLAAPGGSDAEAFCRRLAETIIERGHVLLNGCKNPVDKVLAEAAHGRIQALQIPEESPRLISYVMRGQLPVHQHGKIIRSRISDWDLTEVELNTPEQIELADVVIVFGGHDGTTRAANWARIRNKNLLPVTIFGGAGELLYESELEKFDRKYAARIDRVDYEELASIGTDWPKRAAGIISLAEKITSSRQVAVLMSYAGTDELDDAYDSFQTACSARGYECRRVDESNTFGRIVPEILLRIESAAFVIADLTELRPNVLFELGYAAGLRKPAIITAREGTELPFDLKDLPAILWKGQKRLREDLGERIRLIAERQGRH